MGPVRVGNQAATQLQHDSYGSVILGVSQMFIDERLPRIGDESLYRRLEALGHQAKRVFHGAGRGDLGVSRPVAIHTHSATMCWVALDRLARIAMLLGLDRGKRAMAAGCRPHSAREILSRAWSKKRGAIAGALDHDELDASVLLLPELGLLDADDPRFLQTCDVARQGARPQRLHDALCQ